MAFPSPSIPAPALSTYQLSFNNLAFGGTVRGTPYQLVDLAGLDLAAIQSGDTQRPLQDGEFAGIDVAQGRDIPIDLIVKADSTSLDHARQQLGGAFAPAGALEVPLFVQLPSGCYACMARPRKYNYTVDINTVFTGVGAVPGTPANILLHSTDSRWYGSPSKTATVGLPAPSGGATFPLTFPAVFAAGGVVGVINAWNLGTVPMFPTVVFTGPCTNPWVANVSITGSPRVTFNVALNAGDTLTVDLDFQTVVLVTAGSTAGSPRDNSVVAGSTWWSMLPANGPLGTGLANVVEWGSSDATSVAGTMTLNWADAYPAI